MIGAIVVAVCALGWICLLAFLLTRRHGPAHDWEATYTSHAKALLSGPTGCPTRPLPPTPTRLVKAPEGPRVDPLRLWSMYGPFI